MDGPIRAWTSLTPHSSMHPLTNVPAGPTLASGQTATTHRPRQGASRRLPARDSRAGGWRSSPSHSLGDLTVGRCEEPGTVVVIQRYGLPARRAAAVSSSCPRHPTAFPA